MQNHGSRHETIEPRLVKTLADTLTDLRTVGLSPAAGLYDLGETRWIVGSGEAPEGFPDDGIVLRIEGDNHLVSEVAAGVADPIDLIEFVQDWAMGELGMSWPEARDGADRVAALLTPGIVDGTVMWCERGRPCAAVGELALSGDV